MRATADKHGMSLGADEREALVRRGKVLEHVTIAYNALEGLVSIVAGIFAGSVALVGFGVDSAIEVASALAVLWRLHADADHARREHAEQITLRIVGLCFLTLAAYITFESIDSLAHRTPPEHSIPGIVVTALSVIVMPLLGRAKRTVGRSIGSNAMIADSNQTALCSYLSAITLAGLLLNTLLGWWWADPLAALVMVPIIGHEGIEGLRGESCDDCE